MKLSICGTLLALAAAGFAADNPSDAFYSAIRANDLAGLQKMIQEGANVNLADDRGQTPLMYAAFVGSPEAMKLLLDKGADTNAKNAFDSTALMWSATDIKKVRLLLDHGANVNAVSKQGRSAVLLAAMTDPSIEIVRLLISKGADIKVVDRGKKGLLNAAAEGNDTETIKLMIESGLDVNAADSTGQTPLMDAASNGNLTAVKLLLAKGANVNAVTRDATGRTKNGVITLGKFTPLVLACSFAPVNAEVVKVLLDAGANVDAQDARGMTPLMLASATDHQDPEVIRALLAKKPNTSIKDIYGETAMDWAKKFGPTASFDLMKSSGAPESAMKTAAIPPPAPVEIRPAVERSLALLEKVSGQFFTNGGCISCHHQNITDIAANVARAKGLHVDESAAADRMKTIKTSFASSGPNLLERRDGAGAPDLPLYSLDVLATLHYTPDRMTDALIANIAAQQLTSGRWHKVNDGVARPPIEDGDIFRTTLAIRALKTFGTPGRAAEMEEHIQRAKSWLLAAKPVTAEDRNMQMLGLYWAGADQRTIQNLAKGIIASQRADGGWAQRAEPESDAYATGQTLYALAEAAAFSPRDPVYQKAVKYLLSTQRADGSWYVRSRAPKFQPYFESGFPYGSDQWISSMATGWATTALGIALEEKSVRAVASR